MKRPATINCTRCPRLTKSRSRIVPGAWATMPPDDPDDPTILFIGEAPGETEDHQGKPFVGLTGAEVRHLLWRHGLAPATYITNIVKCHPPGNADPTPDEISNCGEWLRREIEWLQPALVITAGRFSARWALGRDDFTMEMVTGIPYHSPVLDLPVLPMIHPAAGWHRQKDMSYVMNAFKTAGDMWREGWSE